MSIAQHKDNSTSLWIEMLSKNNERCLIEKKNQLTTVKLPFNLDEAIMQEISHELPNLEMIINFNDNVIPGSVSIINSISLRSLSFMMDSYDVDN